VRVAWVSTGLRARGGQFSDAATDLEVSQLRSVSSSCELHVISASLPPGEIQLPLGDAPIPATGVSWRPRYPRTHLGVATNLLLSRRAIDLRARRAALDALTRAVESLLARSQIDLIHFSGGDLAPLAVSAGRSLPVTLLLSDLQFERCRERCATAADAPERFRWRVDALKAKRWERHWYRRVNHIGCTSESLRATLATELGLQACVVHCTDGSDLHRWWTDILDHDGRQALDTSTPARAADVTGAKHDPQGSPTSATVIVCTRDRPELLARSLPDLAAATADHAELLLVEQGERVAAGVLSRLGIAGQVIHDGGTGAARARNIGARNARGEVLVFTDDDCAVPSRWVADHLDALAAPGAVASFGVVKGISRFGDGAEDPVAWPAHHRADSPPWVIGHSSNMAVSRRALLDIAGFDERLGPGAPGGFVCEDADLIVRLLQNGGSILSGVGAPVEHLDWRSAGEDYGNLRAYERGAGAWIGKLLRARPRAAFPNLTERIDLLRERMGTAFTDRRERVQAMLSVASFLRGLIFGLRLERWEALAAHRSPAERAESEPLGRSLLRDE